MYIDKENLFSYDQAVTATVLSDNIVDLGKGDIGPSENASIFASATTPFTGAGTMVIELMTSSDLNAGLTAMVNPVKVATYNVTNAGLLQTDGEPVLAASRFPHRMMRYAQLNYVVTGALAAGKLKAGVVWDVQSN